MDIKKYLKVMPVVAALLLTAACSSEDSEIVEAPQPEQTRIVPFTVTVNSGSGTRATLDASDKYMFKNTDKLYVWDDTKKIYGVLSWYSGDTEGNTYSSTFTGSLTIVGGATLEATTTLYAVIKSVGDIINDDLNNFISTDNCQPVYTNAIATSKAEAVEKFSFFKATSTYGDKNFDFSGTQNSTFLSFDITLDDAASDGTYNVSIRNNGLSDAVRSGSVTTSSKHAKFVVAFPGGTELYNATVQVGIKPEINFGSTISSAKTTLAADKVYDVAKNYNGYKITSSATLPMGLGTVTDKVVVSGVLLSVGSPYEKTLEDLLTAYGAGAFVSQVSDCQRTNGDNVSISGNKTDGYTFSVTSEGESTFKVTLGNPPLSQTIDDLTIKVTKLITP